MKKNIIIIGIIAIIAEIVFGITIIAGLENIFSTISAIVFIMAFVAMVIVNEKAHHSHRRQSWRD